MSRDNAKKSVRKGQTLKRFHFSARSKSCRALLYGIDVTFAYSRGQKYVHSIADSHLVAFAFLINIPCIIQYSDTKDRPDLDVSQTEPVD